MKYIVEKGDTVYVEDIRPSYIWHFNKNNNKNWKKYYRLVYNFSKTYPYAMMARTLLFKTDSVVNAQNIKGFKRQRYINSIQKQLFKMYEKPMRNMTITQGQLLMKLINREVGKSSYNIIKEYKSGLAAGFWQGVALLFGSDLKKPYDPKGADHDIEELVNIWDSGNFPFLYLSIFGEYPPKVTPYKK